MRDPKILVKNDELTSEGIKQYFINVEKNEFKFDTLHFRFLFCFAINYLLQFQKDGRYFGHKLQANNIQF